MCFDAAGSVSWGPLVVHLGAGEVMAEIRLYVTTFDWQLDGREPRMSDPLARAGWSRKG